MQPSIIKALKEGSHPFASHLIFQMFGAEMAKKQHDYLDALVKRRGGPWHYGLREVVDEVQDRELNHRQALEEEAVSIVSEIWGIDASMLRPSIVPEDNFSVPSVPQASGAELTGEQLDEIDKRITFNLLIHGAAIHAMATMYYLARASLDSLDPELFPLYDRVTSESLFSVWMMDYGFIKNMPEAAAIGGDEKISWEPTPVVTARASMFPFLLHELTKGVMEVLAAHQLSMLDEQTLEAVYENADRPEPAYEIMHFAVGPEIWRRFLKAVHPSKLAEAVSTLAAQPPSVVHDIIIDVIQDTPAAARAIADLLEE